MTRDVLGSCDRNLDHGFQFSTFSGLTERENSRFADSARKDHLKLAISVDMKLRKFVRMHCSHVLFAMHLSHVIYYPTIQT